MNELIEALLGHGGLGIAVLLVVFAVIWLALWLRAMIERNAKRCEQEAAAQRNRIDDLQRELYEGTRAQSDAVMSALERTTRCLERNNGFLERATAAMEKIGDVLNDEARRRETARLERRR
jgi:hypothetical protein